MENIRSYDISYFGEFVNKTLERDFLIYDMRRNAKFIGPFTVIFGLIYMMFLIFDYYSISSTVSFTVIFVIRTLVFIVSTLIFAYLSIKEINNHENLIYVITAYEIIVIASFLVIIYKYESLTYLSLFSVVAIVLAIYVMPNRLIIAQVMSLFLMLLFFAFPAKHIVGLEYSDFLQIIGYNLILFIFCNIGAYLTNYYKRKQFADNIELLRVSVTDPLTGIYNRFKFNEELNQWIEACNTYAIPLSLVIFDIDDFKRFNDNFGHLIGDSVIQNVVSTVKRAVRNTDIFARWGGEEFIILLPNTDIKQAREITERMRICIQQIHHETLEKITCSFGLVSLIKNEGPESLIQRADKLLYKAKDRGKNIVVCDSDKSVDQLKTGKHISFVS